MLLRLGRMTGGLSGTAWRHWARTAAALVAATVATSVAAADNNPLNPKLPAMTVAWSWDNAARQLMNLGKFNEAAAILDARLAVVPKDVQALFLKGMIAVAKKDNREAIRIFRSILIDHPDAA